MRRISLAEKCLLIAFNVPLLITVAQVGRAQEPVARKTINLVEPLGSGRIVVSFDGGWQLKAAFLKGNVDQYIGTGWWLTQKTKNPSIKDDGLTPELELINPATGLDVTYSLLPNPVYSTYPTAPPPKRPESCRELDPSLFWFVDGQGAAGTHQSKLTSQTTPAGRPLALASFVYKNGSTDERHIFGFNFADPLCAKIQIFKPKYQATDDVIMKAALDAFVFEPDYSPTSTDYLTLGTLLYKVMKSYAAAAIYYQRAFDTLPASAPLQARRILVDQLSMSYGMSGQVRLSRAANDAAIQTDPDYPLYYYNLACADAEQGNATNARLHLQQAFDRKANTLPGEHLPDPTKDDSILKLKKDKDFWTFVQTLK
jgi:tetratricopeptide (TPR) repeat protein